MPLSAADHAAIQRQLEKTQRGRPAVGGKPEIFGAPARELELSDIARLGAETHSGGQPALQRIRDTHHQIARKLAAGEKAMDISRELGISPSRISVLRHDPTFQTLLDHYRERAVEIWDSIQEKAANLSRLALEELTERLLDEGTDLSINQLREIATAMMDRSGNGPTSTTRTENSVSVSVLHQIRQETAEQNRGNTIDREEADRLWRSERNSGESPTEFDPLSPAELPAAIERGDAPESPRAANRLHLAERAPTSDGEETDGEPGKGQEI